MNKEQRVKAILMVLTLMVSCLAGAELKPPFVTLTISMPIDIQATNTIEVAYRLFQGSPNPGHSSVICQIYNRAETAVHLHPGQVIPMRAVYHPYEPSWTNDQTGLGISCGGGDDLAIWGSDNGLPHGALDLINSAMFRKFKITPASF